MIKLVHRQSKWLAFLIILFSAALVIGGCSSSNHPPHISSLTASAQWVSLSGSCQLQCAASDPDGDELSYSWTASGDISGEGSVVTWTAPAALGNYTIGVKVTDGRGGEATAQLTVGVATNRPPVIDSLTSKYSQVKEGMVAQIECAAADPDGDELTYLWSASGGSITGEGAVADWTAPDKYGIYTINVEVLDGRGRDDIESMEMRVACCVVESDGLKH
jgi:hypothetical protein